MVAQGLMILSKHPLLDIGGAYDKRMPIHHMGFLSATVQPEGIKDRLRVVNVHLVPNFEGHWKGPILHFLGERDVPSIQAEQIEWVSQHVEPYGDDWVSGGSDGELWAFQEIAMAGFDGHYRGNVIFLIRVMNSLICYAL